MDQQKYKKMLGARILSEANDLKRTVASMADDLEVEEGYLQEIVAGERDKSEVYDIIRKMGDIYPIDGADLLLVEDDSIDGVRIMKADESKSTARVFSRKDRAGDKTPYYEYRDTAMSKLGPFKPEWIRELRFVEDADPENPDIAYNNGHSLHQATFFIGPVNFYWEVNGQKFCREMNTGDSNYITPLWRHSFGTRDESQLALIIAVTFGGDVRRAQKELYALGERGVPEYRVDYRDTKKATAQLIKQHMDNACMTISTLQKVADEKGLALDVEALIDEQSGKSFDDLSKVAACLNIHVADLLLPEYSLDDEVVVRHKKDASPYNYPNDEQALYRIYPLATTAKMSLLKGFDVEVQTQSVDMEQPFLSSLHSYAYNYSEAPLKLTWKSGEQLHEAVVAPGDSFYMQPFVRHAFSNITEDNAKLCIFRASGAVNVSVQRELSYYSSTDRLVQETKCWFD